MMKFNWRTSLLFVALLQNAGVPASTQNTVCQGPRVMIQFVPGVDVGLPGVNAGLSRAAGVPLDYMRPLFDDYYLYCVRLEGHVALVEEVLERLRGRPEIRAVELDRFNRLQRNQ